MPRLIVTHTLIDQYCDNVIAIIEGRDESDLHAATRGLRAELHDLLNRQATDQPDGYPAESMPEYSSPTNEIDDEDGEPLPPRSDPTGRAVDRRARGPILEAMTKAMQGVVNGHSNLAYAEGQAVKVKPPLDAPTTPDVIWCVHHETFKLHVPRASDGSRYCSWCRDFRQANGVLPPRELLDRHDQGKRITDADIKRALKRR